MRRMTQQTQPSKKGVFQFKAPEPQPEPVALIINNEAVVCRDYVDGLRVLTYIASMQNPGIGPGQRQKLLLDWLRYCILEDEWEKFDKLCAQYSVDIDGLSAMSGFLCDTYSSMDPTLLESSETGGSTTSASSPAASSSEA